MTNTKSFSWRLVFLLEIQLSQGTGLPLHRGGYSALLSCHSGYEILALWLFLGTVPFFFLGCFLSSSFIPHEGNMFFILKETLFYEALKSQEPSAFTARSNIWFQVCYCLSRQRIRPGWLTGYGHGHPFTGIFLFTLPKYQHTLPNSCHRIWQMHMILQIVLQKHQVLP